MAAVRLATIGYQETTLAAVLDALSDAGTGILIDVRAVAASRRPGFSKRQLAAGLEERGIGYLHLRDLGTPAEGRAAARSGRHDTMKRIFEAHMTTTAASLAFEELAARVAEGPPVCLLCFERHHDHCHRAILSARLEERLGLETRHLLPLP